jgi:hypothetical protein
MNKRIHANFQSNFNSLAHGGIIMNRIKKFLLFVPFIIVIFMALFFTSPVLADDGTLPADSAGIDVTPVTTEEVVVDVAVDTASDEVTTPTDTAVPTDEVTVIPVNEAAQTPTDEAVLDTSADNAAEVVPLDLEDAADVTEGSDPYFLVGGIYYGYTSGGTCPAIVLPANCTTGITNPISTAVTAYNSTVGASGPIYVEAGTYTQSVSVVISSGSTLTGIIGEGSGSTKINFSTADTNLSVSGTTLGFTLQGLTINGDVYSGIGVALVDFNSNSGALTITDVVAKNSDSEGDGIEVTNQAGIVTLKNVESSGNGDEGAKITAAGNVTITNSNFDWNNGANLKVTSTAGSITLIGVSASRSLDGDGVVLSAKTGIKVTNGTFSNNNNGTGMTVVEDSAGAIVFDSVYANANTYDNIYLYHTNGAVTMTNVEANSSTSGYGIEIDNCDQVSGLCTASVAGAITMTNMIASENHWTNIYVTGSGAITMLGITANSSTVGAGLILDNSYAKAASAISVSNTEVNYASTYGLYAISKGNITLNHITAITSGTYGIYLDNLAGTGSVTILKTLGRTTVQNAGNKGLGIFSNGNISVAGVDASTNSQDGAYIENYYGLGNVIVTDSNFTMTSGVTSNGLYVMSRGTITLTNVTANSNNYYGIMLNNRFATSAKAVTLTNVTSSYNLYDGLAIMSAGAITVTSLTAYNDNQTGHTWGAVLLDNTYAAGAASITVSKSSTSLGDNGFSIYSHGNVTLDTVTSNSNTGEGLYIDNSGGTVLTVTVTIKKSAFNSNTNMGIDVDSLGLITLNSTTASNNNVAGAAGVNLYNASGTGGVTITGSASAMNSFDNNHLIGLKIQTNGPVNLNYIETDSNLAQGVYVQNNGTGAVTIANVESSGNTLQGIYVRANGTITITNPYVVSNTSSDYGVDLDNTTGTGGITVQGSSASLTGTIVGNHDSTNGANLGISTNGPVIVKYIFSTDAKDTGIWISNTGGSGTPVTLTGVTANGTTGGTGIYIQSNGVVTITGATSNNSANFGIYVANSGGTPRNVVMTNITVTNSGNDGVHIASSGAVNLAGITVNYSGGIGLYVTNSSGTAGITLTYSGSLTNTFAGNTLRGVYLVSSGPVTVNKTLAVSNNQTNIQINNLTGTGNVTLNAITVNSSAAGYGLDVDTKGAILITGINAISNKLDGVNLQNSSGTANVTIINSSSSGTTNGSGFNIESYGFVTITNVSSNSNAQDGIRVLDVFGTGVTLQNSGTVMNNLDSNSGYGVVISSSGPVKVTNTSALGSSYSGIYIENYFGPSGITLTNVRSNSTISYGIYLSSVGNIIGTSVESAGNSSYQAILIDNCEASGSSCTGTGSVILTGVKASGSMNGLEVHSNGAITVNNLDVQYNSTGYGALLDNHLSSTKAPVSVYKATASSNYYDGIYIRSLGNVILDGINAVGNGTSGSSGNGVDVENSDAGATGNVTVSSSKGANTFNSNYGEGLLIVSNGAIIISNVTANFNGDTGIAATTYGVGKAFNATNVVTNGNAFSGINGTATANSTFTGVKAINNGIYNSDCDGIYMDVTGYNFTISNSVVTGNGQNGMEIWTGGLSHTVKVVNTFYFGNDHYAGTGTVKDILTDATLLVS